MRTVLRGAAAVAVVAVAAIPASASEGARRVVGDCARSRVRPATIWVSCNNPSFSFTRLRWSSFGGPTAHATGVIRAERCSRACSGRFSYYPVKLSLSDAEPCPDGYRDYRLAVSSYSSPARLPGAGANPTPLRLFCPLTD
jgi:hypothetical protein